MLKKDTIKKLKDLGFDFHKFEAAIKAEDEQDFALPEINNLTEADLTERDKNTIAAVKPEIFKTGKDAGIEIAGKAIAKKYGLIDIDVKDPDKIIAALDAKVATGDTGLKEQIALLQKDKLVLEQAVEAEKGNTIKLQRDTELLTSLPANRLPNMSDRDYVNLVKGNLEFDMLEGVQVVKRDGQILRDTKTHAPIGVKDAVTSLFAEKKLIAESGNKGGRGGGDNSVGSVGGIKNQTQAMAAFAKEFPDGGTNQYTAYVGAIAKETTDFNWDE